MLSFVRKDSCLNRSATGSVPCVTRLYALFAMQLLFHAAIAKEQRRCVAVSLRSLRETMMNRIVAVQECDATEAQSGLNSR